MDPLFETNRATDMAYILQYVMDKISRENVAKKDKRWHVELQTYMHETLGEVFGVVDLMVHLGNYANRATAAQQWRKIKARMGPETDPTPVLNGPHPLGADMEDLPQSIDRGELSVLQSQPMIVKNRVHEQSIDHCTIPDFFNHVLPHMTGPIATVIKEARGRTATLVSTGSAMASALTEANAKSARNASEDVRRVVEQVREQTEDALVEDAQIPLPVMAKLKRMSGVIPVSMEVFDYPSGQCFYHRSSLANRIPGLRLPEDCKITEEVSKVGRTDEPRARSQSADYKKDFAFFDTIITTRTLSDSRALEGCYKAAIHPFRSAHAQEYYNVQAYNDIHQVVVGDDETPSDAAKMHLMRNTIQMCGHLIEKIHIADVDIQTDWGGRSRHYVTVNYSEVEKDHFGQMQAMGQLALGMASKDHTNIELQMKQEETKQEEERTKQEQEKTKQLQEKTKQDEQQTRQLELQLELKRLEERQSSASSTCELPVGALRHEPIDVGALNEASVTEYESDCATGKDMMTPSPASTFRMSQDGWEVHATLPSPLFSGNIRLSACKTKISQPDFMTLIFGGCLQLKVWNKMLNDPTFSRHRHTVFEKVRNAPAMHRWFKNDSLAAILDHIAGRESGHIPQIRLFQERYLEDLCGLLYAQRI